MLHNMAIAVRMDMDIGDEDFGEDDGVDDHDGPPIAPNDVVGDRQMNRNGQVVRNRVARVDLRV